ncbi:MULTISPECIES: hypothetical protein [unclassified Nocardiopsis]|uniref:hypothetical protein n=1 Tax=Nocardiopsis TaxID=2013 RepID=UPI00387AEC9B
MTTPRPTVRPDLSPERVARITARLDGLTAPARALNPPDPVRAHLWSAAVLPAAASAALLAPAPSWAGGALLGLGAAVYAGAVAVYARPRTFSAALGAPRWTAPALFTALAVPLAAVCAAAAHLLHAAVRDQIAGPGAGSALLAAGLALAALVGANLWARGRRSVHRVDHVAPHLLPGSPWVPDEAPGGLYATRTLHSRERALETLRAAVDLCGELRRASAPLPDPDGLLDRLRAHEWRAARALVLRARRVRRELHRDGRFVLPSVEPGITDAVAFVRHARAVLNAQRAARAAHDRGDPHRAVRALTDERDAHLRRLRPCVERILREPAVDTAPVRSGRTGPRPRVPGTATARQQPGRTEPHLDELGADTPQRPGPSGSRLDGPGGSTAPRRAGRAGPLLRLAYALGGLAALGAAWAALNDAATGTVLFLLLAPALGISFCLGSYLRGHRPEWNRWHLVEPCVLMLVFLPWAAWESYEFWEAIAWWAAPWLFEAPGDATAAFYLLLTAPALWLPAATGWARALPVSRG